MGTKLGKTLKTPGMFEKEQNASSPISLKLFVISYKHTHLALLGAETPC